MTLKEFREITFCPRIVLVDCFDMPLKDCEDLDRYDDFDVASLRVYDDETIEVSVTEPEKKGVTLFVNIVVLGECGVCQAFFLQDGKLVDLDKREFLEESVSCLRFFIKQGVTQEGYVKFKAYAKGFFEERGIELSNVILSVAGKVWQ